MFQPLSSKSATHPALIERGRGEERDGSEIPNVKLTSGQFMPIVGVGTASDPPASAEVFRAAMLEAITIGYRHFDTAAVYGTEQPLGEAVAEALQSGLIKSREELFITSKIWSTDTHHDRVIPALQLSLRRLQLKSKEAKFSIDKEDFIPMDMKSVWEALEECQRLGLVKKLEDLLSTARIVPSVNQVEMHPVWQQKKLISFCKEKGIQVVAYSPLGAKGTTYGSNQVMDCDVLKEIALARGKSIAQVSLRWIYEQGASFVIKSFTKERMKANIEIFDWELSEEELHKISLIPQSKIIKADFFLSAAGPYKSLDELWDGEI